MPQSRGKIAFSGKQKKAQLQSKKRRTKLLEGSGENGVKEETEPSESSEVEMLKKRREIRSCQASSFRRETDAEILKEKEAAHEPINPASASGLEITELQRVEIIKMPQSRGKIAFSGKQKKAHLQSKKRRTKLLEGSGENGVKEEAEPSESSEVEMLKKRREIRSCQASSFHRETDAEILKQKEAALKPINPVSASGLEITVEDFFLQQHDFPKRPQWDRCMSPKELKAREQKYFTKYISDLKKKFSWKRRSYFELDLETWRQLWRVLEMSDIVLMIVDIRYCAAMFPPSVYNYVTEMPHKDMIVVLNKIDLAPAPLVVAWKHYFQQKYPAIHILTFTSFPAYNLIGNQENKAGLQIRRGRGKLRMAAEGAKTLLEACKRITKNEVDFSSWFKKISEEMHLDFDDDKDIEVGETAEVRKMDTGYFKHEKDKDKILTIGCIGYPNVGKSSLINAIMGKKVVGVSRSPGHTKHFQTIHLTPNVRLCDCPGLVFPSKIPKALQILMGSFPIAQARVPFPAVQYLAERLDLPNLLKLQHPRHDEQWSTMDICNAWALKNGWYSARTGRSDSHRAANNLLRMALDGKICLCLHPPGYSSKKDYWEKHADVQLVERIQGKTSEQAGGDETSEKDKLESSSGPEDSDSDIVVDISNRFSVLGTEE